MTTFRFDALLKGVPARMLNAREATYSDEPFVLALEEDFARGVLDRTFGVPLRPGIGDNFPSGCKIIVVGGEDVGCISVWADRRDIEIEHFCLRPDYRRRGHGSLVLSLLLDDALIAGTDVRITMPRSSLAVTLFERLGFSVDRQFRTRLSLKWTPENTKACS